MTDYYGLLEGRLAVSNEVLKQVFSRMNAISPGHPDLNWCDNPWS
jgi:hypothetical protein